MISASRAGRRAVVVPRIVALTAATVIGLGALARSSGEGAAPAQGSATTAPPPYVTWIEARAPRVFEPAGPRLRGMQVTYRIDAHVLLPLGFTTMELWNRSGVGATMASYRDSEAASGDVFRTFELFATSYPEQASGFDRRGFFREALRIAPSGVLWTAYFGAMTSWPEQTLSEARKAASGPPPHTYEAIDGLSAPLEARASIFEVSTRGQFKDPAALWSAVRPQLDVLAARSNQALVGTPVRPLPALAFLGALQVSLRSAAVHRATPLAPAATRLPFVHNGLVRQLEVASISRDASRGRQAVSAGFARNAADVYELRYRIINPGDEDGQFRLWVELPPGVADDHLAPPLPPLAWEMRLRSYLKLVFERVS